MSQKPEKQATRKPGAAPQPPKTTTPAANPKPASTKPVNPPKK